MLGKHFETIIFLLSIGVLQYFSVLGCQTNSDCSNQTTTGSRKQCCHNVVPPRCMFRIICFLNRKSWQNPTHYPKFTIPDYNRFTIPDLSKFTPPNNNWPTVPNIDFPTVPNNDFPTVPNIDFPTVPNIDVPTFSYNDNNDDHYDTTNNSSGFSSTALIGILVAVILLSTLTFWLRWVRHKPRLNHFPQNCNVQPPAATNTGRTNFAAQQNEEPSRIVIVAVTRHEDDIRRQNITPDGEPPFLSEEEIFHNLQNNCTQEPPSYEEAREGTCLPKYEDVVNMDQPPPPAYPEVQSTSRSSVNSYQITPPIQQNLPISNVNPPSYEEAQAADNEVANPLP